MIHRCAKCLGVDAELFKNKDFSDDDKVTYNQWTTVDRSTLVCVQERVDEFINHVCDAVDSLTAHHFVSKSQSRFCKSTRESLADNQALITLDLAENYTFIIQDAIQGYHWTNDQATLHPFSIYNKGNHYFYCVISDHMKHVTETVYAFINVILKDLKLAHPHITEVIYFSDGAGSQYKNKKNFCNLMHHEADFGLKAT